ncbi:MAG: hypothetical protein WD490_06385 [Opitutales bacterium]
MLLTLLIATATGRELEVCKHLSGTAHGFGGSQCDGGQGHSGGESNSDHSDPLDDGHHHEHKDSHSSHHGPGEHHEPCTHESVQVDEDMVRGHEDIRCTSVAVTADLAGLEQIVE